MRYLITLLLLSSAAFAGNIFIGEKLVIGGTLPPAPSIIGYPIDFLQTFEAGTAGDVMTTNLLTSSTLENLTGSSWLTGITSFNAQSTLVYGQVGGKNLSQWFSYNFNGTLYDGSGTRSMFWPFTGNWPTDWESAFHQLPTPNTIASTNFSLAVDILYQPVGLSGQDLLGITFSSGAWCIMEGHCDGAGHVSFNMHGKGFDGLSTTSKAFAISSNSTYTVCIRQSVRFGEAEGVIQLADTGELIGSFSCAAQGDEPVAYFGIQDYLVFTNGGVYFDNLAAGINANARLPLGPITVPPPTSLAATQVSTNQIALTWGPDICLRYSISRFNAESNAWTVVTNNCEAATFTDGGLTLSNTYSYKVTGIIGDYQSVASTNSAPLLLTDHTIPMPLMWVKADEGSGTTAADSSGNGHGMIFNGANTWVTDDTGHAAIRTDGTGSYLVNASGWDTATNCLTVSYWSKVAINSGGSPWGYSGSQTPQTVTWFYDGTQSSQYQLSFNNSITFCLFLFPPFPTTEMHNHLLVIDNRTTTPTVKFYLDGVSQTVTPIGAAGLAENFSAGKWYLGGNPSVETYNDIRVWAGDVSSYAGAIYGDHQ